MCVFIYAPAPTQNWPHVLFFFSGEFILFVTLSYTVHQAALNFRDKIQSTFSPLQPTTKLFIDGKFVESKTSEWLDVHNPVSV